MEQGNAREDIAEREDAEVLLSIAEWAAYRDNMGDILELIAPKVNVKKRSRAGRQIVFNNLLCAIDAIDSRKTAQDALKAFDGLHKAWFDNGDIRKEAWSARNWLLCVCCLYCLRDYLSVHDGFDSVSYFDEVDGIFAIGASSYNDPSAREHLMAMKNIEIFDGEASQEAVGSLLSQEQEFRDKASSFVKNVRDTVLPRPFLLKAIARRVERKVGTGNDSDADNDVDEDDVDNERETSEVNKKQKSRVSWTEEENEAAVAGYEVHKNKWARIKSDRRFKTQLSDRSNQQIMWRITWLIKKGEIERRHDL